MSKIYTKKGDDGTTSLLGGERISKQSCHSVLLGDLDELNSWLGLLRSGNEYKTHEKYLKTIQKHLMLMSSILAGADLEFSADYTLTLEIWIDEETAYLPPLKNFIIPTGQMHVVRAVCRRAERSLGNLTYGVDPTIKSYINRLSDYLFTLARVYSKEEQFSAKEFIKEN